MFGPTLSPSRSRSEIPAPSPWSQTPEPEAKSQPLAVSVPSVPKPRSASAPAPAPSLDTQELSSAASQLFLAMDGLGTDERAIHRVLAGRTREELDALRRIYADHYPGHDLDKDLRAELSGTELEAAQAALSGDPIKQAAAALKNAAAGVGTDEQAVHEALARINKLTAADTKTGKVKDPAAREKLAAEFERITGRSLEGMLTSELSGSERRVALKEARGDQAGAAAVKLDDAMHGGLLGLGTDEQLIREVLGSVGNKGERARLLNAYKAETQRELSHDLSRELSGAEKDEADALLAEDRHSQNQQARRAAQAKVAAARLAIASQWLGTDEDMLFEQFEGGSDAALRTEIQEAFNERYGQKAGGRDFEQMLQGELGGNDLERARQLVKQGKMDPAFALKYAMDGVGTDEDLIRAVLRRCTSKKELDSLRASYAALVGKRNLCTLDHDLAEEMSGRDAFMTKQLLAGSATRNLRAEEKITFANQAYAFERGDRAGIFGSYVADLFFESGRVLDTQHSRLNTLGTKLQTGVWSLADQERLQTLTEYHQQDVANYQVVRDSIANTGAVVGTAVVGTMMTLVSWGAAGPALASVLGALLGSGAGLGLKLGVQGDSYSTEDFALDLAMTLVAAATAGSAGPLAQVAAKVAALAKSAPLLELAVLEALKGGQLGLASGVASGLLDEATWRGPGNGAAHFVHKAGKSALSVMATGLSTAGTNRLLGQGTRCWNALVGAAGGVAGGSAQAVLDSGGELDGDAFAASLRRNVAMNVLSGAALANLPREHDTTQGAASPPLARTAAPASPRYGGARIRGEDGSEYLQGPSGKRFAFGPELDAQGNVWPQVGPEGEIGMFERGYYPDRIFRDHILPDMPSEGWKFHISSDAASAGQIAEIALPLLKKNGISHKVVQSAEALDAYMHNGQTGKYITIYPRSEQEAKDIVTFLDSALSGFTGPKVKNELPLGRSGLFFRRYGGFDKNTIRDPETGKEIPDDRTRACPPGIVDPFINWAPEAPR